MYTHFNWDVMKFIDQSKEMIYLIVANGKCMFDYEPYPLFADSAREYCKTHLADISGGFIGTKMEKIRKMFPQIVIQGFRSNDAILGKFEGSRGA